MSTTELLLLELDEEMKKTRTTLERVPSGKNDFAPHSKSMPMGKLAPHVAQLAGFGVIILTTPEFDFSTGSIKPLPFESSAQLVKAFDVRCGEGSCRSRSHSGGSLERKLETELSGQDHLPGIKISGVPPDVSESPGASPRSTGRLSAPER